MRHITRAGCILFTGTALLLTTACGQTGPAGGEAANAASISELPLKRGFYVASDTACGQASNATLLLVRRRGVSGARGMCDIRAIEQTGPHHYRATEACGGFPGEPAGEPGVILYEIPDATTFGYRAEDSDHETRYRYCEQSGLPDPWRDNDISDLLE